jgi:hypothetical protein
MRREIPDKITDARKTTGPTRPVSNSKFYLANLRQARGDDDCLVRVFQNLLELFEKVRRAQCSTKGASCDLSRFERPSALPSLSCHLK